MEIYLINEDLKNDSTQLTRCSHCLIHEKMKYIMIHICELFKGKEN